MKSSPEVLFFLLIFYILSTTSAMYCKPGKKYFNGRRCLRCPKCRNGEFTNKTTRLKIDNERGALNCYSCTSCPYGKYSNDETRIGRDIQCAEWLNCTADLDRTYITFPDNTTRGQCGKCLNGYFPMIEDMNDSPCSECSWPYKDRLECHNITAPSPTHNLSRGIYVERRGSSNDALHLGLVTALPSSFIILTVIVVCLLCKRRKSRLKEKRRNARVDESFQIPIADAITVENENHKLLENDLETDSDKELGIKSFELSDQMKELFKGYILKIDDPVVRTFCSRSVIHECLQYLCENLIPNRQDVFLCIGRNEQESEQCFALIEKWLQLNGRLATMYTLYEAVHGVYKKCLELNNEGGIKLYLELLEVIQKHMQSIKCDESDRC